MTGVGRYVPPARRSNHTTCSLLVSAPGGVMSPEPPARTATIGLLSSPPAAGRHEEEVVPREGTLNRIAAHAIHAPQLAAVQTVADGDAWPERDQFRAHAVLPHERRGPSRLPRRLHGSGRAPELFAGACIEGRDEALLLVVVQDEQAILVQRRRRRRCPSHEWWRETSAASPTTASLSKSYANRP